MSAVTLHSALIIEFSIDKPVPQDSVGTCGYEPTEIEKPLLDRLSEEGQMTFQSKIGEDIGGPYAFRLSGHEGEFVSWFGIVREIRPRLGGLGAVLRVQNTYSSGFTDCHTQTVEINGAGDFEIALSELPEDLVPLVLVRVYGKVLRGTDDLPRVEADYLRVWHWFQFNFMDYGEDHSNPKWRAAMRLPPNERVYHIGVSGRYYDERLGPTYEQMERLKSFYRNDTEFDFREYPEANLSKTYSPSEREQSYFDRLPPGARLTYQSRFLELSRSIFTLRGHVGQFVSWLGVVREIDHPLGERGGSLLVEKKYFNGQNDEHLQTVSMHGGGDFRVALSNLSEDLQPLTLVRIYGEVLREEETLPVIKADFVRSWTWSHFNFRDYGEEEGSNRWQKDRRLSSWPAGNLKLTADCYIDQLGTTSEQAKLIRDRLRWKRAEKPSPEAPSD